MGEGLDQLQGSRKWDKMHGSQWDSGQGQFLTSAREDVLVSLCSGPLQTRLDLRNSESMMLLLHTHTFSFLVFLPSSTQVSYH